MKTRRPSWWLILVLCVLLAGAALRLYHYFVNRSLWLDEAMLALNIIRRTPAELLQPLDYAQGAPLGFLLAQKLMVFLLGTGEMALRAVPLAVSIAALPLYYWQARRYGQRSTALLALLLFSLSVLLIYYASEAKQYTSDVFFCVLLFATGRDLLEPKPKALTRFALAGVAAVCFSHPAIFVIAGFLLVAGSKQLAKRQWQHLLRLLAVGATTGTAFVSMYLLSLRGLAANNVLLDFWDFAFMPMPPWSDWHWFVLTFDGFMENPIGLTFWLYKVLLLIGVASLFWRRADYGAVYLLPFAFTLAASALHLYPFAGRLILFLTPPALYLLAEGATWSVERVPPVKWRGEPVARWGAWGAVTVACLLPFVRTDWERLQWPYVRENLRPALAYIAERRQDGDSFYAYKTVAPTLEYYGKAFGIDPAEVTLGTYYGQFADTGLAEVEALQEHKRVWVVIARPYRGSGNDDEAAIVARLDELGRQEDRYQQMGVSVYLYSFD